MGISGSMIENSGSMIHWTRITLGKQLTLSTSKTGKLVPYNDVAIIQ